MKRINGFINLERYKDEIGDKKKGFITINNINYFYKRCKDDWCYRELIANKITELLGIPSVIYIPVLIPSSKGEYDLGVLSKDYKKHDYIYISGHEILADYNDELYNEWYETNKENNRKFNNLENIWNALEYRYRFINNKTSIVKKILNSIIKDVFLFSIITQNTDKHFENWEVEENVHTNEINLNLSYDNEDIFLTGMNYKPLLLCNSYYEFENWADMLEKFFYISSYEYFLLFKEMLNKLTPKILFRLINLVEKERGIKIPFETKKDIMVKYNNHYKKLKYIVEKYDKNLVKKKEI